MSILKKTGLLPLVAIISTTLAGCGGGSGEDKEVQPKPIEIEPENAAPIVKLDDANVEERKAITLKPKDSDPDGEVVAYKWEKLSGPDEVILTDADKPELTLTAPQVTADTDIKLKITVTDDDGQTASDEATLTVTSKKLEVALKGKVTDNDIPNAEVSVIIGDRQFTATADENGNYTVDLSVDDSLADSVITVTASGTEEQNQQNVELISNVSSVQNAVDSAGEDGILDNEESSTVNVTNVTTVIDALMRDANGGEPVADAEDLDNLSHSYEPELVLPMSGCLKAVIDNGLPLPELPENPDGTSPRPLTNTAELARNLTGISQCITDIANDEDLELADLITDVIQDPDLVSSGFDADDEGFESTYYFKGPDGEFWGDRLKLNEDGTGEILNVAFRSDITWQANDSGLILTYPDGIKVGTYTDPNGGRIWDVMRTETRITRILSNDNVAQVSIEHTQFQRDTSPQGAFPDSQPETTDAFYAQMVIETGLKNPADFLTTDVEYSIPVPNFIAEASLPQGVSAPDDQYKGLGRGIMGLTLTESGQAEIKIYETDTGNNGQLVPETVAATYEIENNHLRLAADYNGNDINFDFVFFNDQPPYNTNGMMTDTLSGSERSSPITSYLLEKNGTGWNEDNMAGYYSLGWNLDNNTRHFWLELKEDGTAVNVITEDKNDNGVIEPDQQNEVRKTEGRWQINGAELRIRRYGERGSGKACASATFEPADGAGCIIWHERVLDLFNILNGDTYYVQHRHNYFNIFSAGLGSGGQGGIYYTALDNRKWLKLDRPPVDIETPASPANAPEK